MYGCQPEPAQAVWICSSGEEIPTGLWQGIAACDAKSGIQIPGTSWVGDGKIEEGDVGVVTSALPHVGAESDKMVCDSRSIPDDGKVEVRDGLGQF